MPIAMAIPALIGAGSSIAGGIIGSRSANAAAQIQSQAAQQAGQLVQGTANTAAGSLENATLQSQQGVEGATNAAINDATAGANAGITAVGDATTGANAALGATLAQQRQNQQGYLNAGQMSLNDLQKYLAGEGGQQFSFTPEQFQNTPGFQFELEQGARALQRSQAARGGAVSGSAQKSLLGFSQGLASTRYGEAQDRAARIHQMNRDNMINPLMSLIGVGQNATQAMNADEGRAGAGMAGNLMDAGQFAGNTLNNLGQYSGDTRFRGATSIANMGMQGAEGAGRLRLGGAQSAGDYMTQGANAQAAGKIASGNAISGMLGGIGNAAGGYFSMRNINAGNRGRTIPRMGSGGGDYGGET
jgi:hypothetical protein